MSQRPDGPPRERDVTTTFFRWSVIQAAFHRGWWLVTSVYLVVIADLSVSQLSFYGAVLAVTALLAEVPTGVMADTISRRWSLAIGHLEKGTGMAMMGFITAFPLILVSQFFWGLGGTFLSGADVAWVSDELNQPKRIAGVLIARARLEQLGSAIGIVGFGLLAWATDFRTAIVVAGLGMIVLGLYVALRFTERNFKPVRGHPWRESATILRRGATLARSDRQLMVVFGATFLVHGGGAAFDFLSQRQLIDVGFPQEHAPIVWFTALGLATLLDGAIALRVIQSHIDGAGAAPRVYAAGAVAGALGLLVLAQAPNAATGMAGVLLVGGIAWPVTRSVSVVWVNRRATSDVRATVHSFLAQAEAFGEIVAGIAFAVLALAASISIVSTWAAAVVGLAGVLVVWSRAGRAASTEV